MISTTFYAMGSSIQILLDNETLPAQIALQRAKSYFQYCEHICSRFMENSELSQLNRNGHGLVSPILWNILQQALRFSKKSNGLFTPTILPALLQTGYSKDFNAIKHQVNDKNGLENQENAFIVPWQYIQTTAKNRYVNLHGAKLDLGGIAKGWCAQQVCIQLQIYGPVLINAGGDITSHGSPKGATAWLIDLMNPRPSAANINQVHFLLPKKAAATSGVDYRQWQYNGNQQNHIIDPRTAKPTSSDIFSITILADDIVEAEVVCKTLLILGSTEAKQWLNLTSHLEACWFLRDGSFFHTPNFPRLSENV